MQGQCGTAFPHSGQGSTRAPKHPCASSISHNLLKSLPPKSFVPHPSDLAYTWCCSRRHGALSGPTVRGGGSRRSGAPIRDNGPVARSGGSLKPKAPRVTDVGQPGQRGDGSGRIDSPPRSPQWHADGNLSARRDAWDRPSGRRDALPLTQPTQFARQAPGACHPVRIERRHTAGTPEASLAALFVLVRPIDRRIYLT